MQCLHFNICNGMTQSPTALQGFGEFLQAHPAIDHLLLNEYRPSSALDQVLQDAGYAHSVVNASHTNQAAIWTRASFPLAFPLPSHLRLVALRLPSCVVVSFHARPGGVLAVCEDIEGLLYLLSTELPPEQPILLATDLNSLARQDAQALAYPQQPSHPKLQRYAIADRCDYSATDCLLAAGFCDIRGPGQQATVPTRIGNKARAGIPPLRIDYCFSRNLPVSEVSVIAHEPFPEISDHYPLLITCPE